MISDSFARKFVARVGLADTAGLLDQNGRATEALRQRAARAVVARTYGIHPVVAGLLDGRSKLKNVYEALLYTAPQWAAMKVAVSGGAIATEFDITADLIEAVRHANVAKQAHLAVAEYIAQGSLDQISPATRELLRLFADDAKLLADGLRAFASDAVSAGSLNLLGQATPTEVLAAAVAKAQPLVATVKSRKKASAAMYGESGHRRVELDAYLTIDAFWIIPALLSKLQLRGPVFEPCAGRGHLVDELRKAGFKVKATDLIDYGRADITPGVDLFSLTTDDLAGAGSIVMNLPYDVLDQATGHILSIAQPLGLQVASLVRAEWPHAKTRRKLVHDNPHLDKIVFLSKRPRWKEREKQPKVARGAIGHNSGESEKKKDDSPRHYFAWVVWDFAKDTTLPATIHWAGPR